MKVILHICCGVCAAGVVERLTREGYQVHGLFYNPNIYPLSEYNLRLEAARKVAEEMNFPLHVVPYVPEEWFEVTGSLQNEPEGGRRCEVCFRLRLQRTYLYMKECGGHVFTTTLTVSPRKSAEIINRIGQDIGSEQFLVRDFKKKEGFKQAIATAKQLSLYRQNYCGCIYSMNNQPGDTVTPPE
jgi:predicted adenine nucleotide alpha hydrolase (AANH) superfamily ATPase